jgi:membrane protein implicated in regulation of membrane protease activity
MILNVQAGCLLPALMLLNLFFGWMFLSTGAWLCLEGVLILLFVLNASVLVRRVRSWARPKSGKIIDVEAEVVEERLKLKKED